MQVDVPNADKLQDAVACLQGVLADEGPTLADVVFQHRQGQQLTPEQLQYCICIYQSAYVFDMCLSVR